MDGQPMLTVYWNHPAACPARRTACRSIETCTSSPATSSSTNLGEQQLSIDQGVTTPTGYVLKLNSVDIDAGASGGGCVYYNVLQNNGSIAGSLNTPLALPVINPLPALGVYDITQSATTDAGRVTINVSAGDCAIDPAFCDTGR